MQTAKCPVTNARSLKSRQIVDGKKYAAYPGFRARLFFNLSRELAISTCLKVTGNHSSTLAVLMKYLLQSSQIILPNLNQFFTNLSTKNLKTTADLATFAFDLQSSCKTGSKLMRTVLEQRVDLDGLYSALQAIDLFNLI